MRPWRAQYRGAGAQVGLHGGSRTGRVTRLRGGATIWRLSGEAMGRPWHAMQHYATLYYRFTERGLERPPEDPPWAPQTLLSCAPLAYPLPRVTMLC